MSSKSSPDHTKHTSSRIPRLKKRVSYASPSSLNSQLTEDDTGGLEVPAHHAEDQLPPASTSQHQSSQVQLPAAYTSHRQSISNVFVHSTAKPVSAQISPQHQRFAITHHLEDSANRSHSFKNLMPPSPLQLPQEHVSIFQGRSHPHRRSQGPFNQAHDFVMNNPVFNENIITVGNFMEKLHKHTIIGAEFDSSDRDPPPRCHPGTRLAIIQRCMDFIFESSGPERLRWVVGAAGVGKSAIMQMVAEKAPDGIIFASVFLSVNGRRDGTKTIVTIAYQLAVKCEPYRRFLQDETARDPSLLRKSLSVHFRRFIVEPFIHQHLYNPTDRFLIIIDGLDECENLLTQRELLQLISDFCITYPASPIVWIVASRPEPHITSFFDNASVAPIYTREEIVIDTDEAREDVQRYLRAELKKIQHEFPTLKRKREWPTELEFTIIATAAGGLFAYAATIIRYIADPHYGDPVARLRYVLKIIGVGRKDDIFEQGHPMAQLDALYARILSDIPDDVMINTRKLLLYTAQRSAPFRQQCNVLGLTEDAAYGAVRHLYAVAKIPEPHKADDEYLDYFHKSFEDFLFDFKRSGFSADIQAEIDELDSHTSWRVIKEVPDDDDGTSNSEDIEYRDGYLKGDPGICGNISLSWPGDERFPMADDELRLKLYHDAITAMMTKFSPDNVFFGNISCFHVLTTRFTVPSILFPFLDLRYCAFNKFRHELTEIGSLKQVVLRALDYAAIGGYIELQFTSPIGGDIECSNPWNPSCKHAKRQLQGSQQGQGWSTRFRRIIPDESDTADNDSRDDATDANIPRFNVVAVKASHRTLVHKISLYQCYHCSRRLAAQLINNPDQPATCFVDSTELSYVEFSLVDPDDGVSEWRYRLYHSGYPTHIDT